MERRDQQPLPDKQYFKIGEVSELVGVDPHVLRYWEAEFKVIKPLRAGSRQRLYRRSDVENLLRIRGLLYDQGYTIAGARKALKETIAGEEKPAARKTTPPPVDTGRSQELVSSLKEGLSELKRLLES